VQRLRLRARPPLTISLLISLVSGLALSLAFPPAGLWPIAFVAMAPLLWLLEGCSARRGLLLGFVFGLGFYGATIYWIFLFGALAWTGLTIVLALGVGIFGLLVPIWRRPGRPFVNAVVIAALWTVVDWIRSAWPLGGFGWGSLGVSQVDNRFTVRLASVAGVWGVTFLVVLVNALIAELAGEDGDRRRRIVGLIVIVAVVTGPVLIPFAGADGEPLDVAVIQVDVREARAATAGQEDVRVAELNIEQHERLIDDPPDLVVWGEGALDPDAAADPETVAAVQGVVSSVGSPTIVGAVLNDPDHSQHTSALLLDGSGQLVDRYDKVHLVPFGEYVPFRSRLSFIDAIDQIPVDRVPGEEVHPLSVEGLPPIGVPICFENSFPSIPREMVRQGAGFLVVTVNNASYGTTAASAQHLQFSQLRAIEVGRWTINGAVSGISAFIDPSGRVVASEGLFEPAILRDTIRSSTQRTWYVRLGDWVPWLLLAFLVIVFALPRRRASKRPDPEPLSEGYRTLVILPTYEERATIEQVLIGVRKAPQDVDVFVVDDSSPDGTGQVVAEIATSDPHVRLLERPAKSGLASAYLEGFRIGLAEGYDVIVEMDSDLSHDPTELPRLLEAAETGKDLVVGSRYIPGGSVTNWSRLRVALSRAGNLYARIMLSLPVHDATSGYRAYRRRLLEDLVAQPIASDGYGFQIELVMRSWDLGYVLGEAPITFREREHGQSKLSRRIVVEALWLVTIWGFQRRLRAPK
jgi:apolipoprotein N-acyltransferase